MNRIVFLLILLGAGLLDAAVSNEVPLEVRYRNSTRRADYERMETAYRERQKKRHEILVEQNKKVVAQINTPPWLRTATKADGVSDEVVPGAAAVSAETAKSPERKSSLFDILRGFNTNQWCGRLGSACDTGS